MKTIESLVESFLDKIPNAEITGYIGKYSVSDIDTIKNFFDNNGLCGFFDKYFMTGFLIDGQYRNIHLIKDALAFGRDGLQQHIDKINEILIKQFNDSYYL